MSALAVARPSGNSHDSWPQADLNRHLGARDAASPSSYPTPTRKGTPK